MIWQNAGLKHYDQENKMRKLKKEDLNNFINAGFTSTSSFWNDIKSHQEPERDEQGTLYGYKVLIYYNERFLSPVRHTQWNLDGSLVSDQVPTKDNTNGIYCTKRVNDDELKYLLIARFGVIVKVALSGDVIESETGFRAEKAQIIGVLQNGNWKSYQDTQERARYYSDQDSERFTYYQAGNPKPFRGTWNISTRRDSSPNVAEES